MTVEKISAVTLRVANMRTSVRFYRDVLGLEIVYGGEDADFSSLRTKEGKDPILNLERSNPATQWGRLIFYISDVDAFWSYLTEKGLRPEKPHEYARPLLTEGRQWRFPSCRVEAPYRSGQCVQTIMRV